MKVKTRICQRNNRGKTGGSPEEEKNGQKEKKHMKEEVGRTTRTIEIKTEC